MVEKLTAIQDRMSQRCLTSSQPCDSHARLDAPEMLVKLTAMQDRMSKDA